MPFSQHKLDPKTRDMLAGVFERAWEQVRTLHSLAAQPQNEQAARDELAKHIAAAHKNGERDPEVIALVALRAFDSWAKPLSRQERDYSRK